MIYSLRDKVVGESVPYRVRFRNLLVEHESLLTGVWGTGSANIPAATALPPRSRKDYEYLKPSMLHSDCTKRELQKFITDARTWTSKTISETEKNEEEIVLQH